MKRSITVAFAALLTACSPSPPQTASTPQPAPPVSAAETGPCATGFVEIVAGRPACGIALQANGSLIIRQNRTKPIVVSHQQSSEGDVAIAAKKLILYPPAREGGFRIIQACEDVTENSLCWAVRLLNLRTGALQEIAAGKYGPDRWIRWSPAEHRAALISRNEGAEWLHIVDTATGTTTAYPGASENANWTIDRESFAWNGDGAFTVKIKTCETCASETRSFTLP